MILLNHHIWCIEILILNPLLYWLCAEPSHLMYWNLHYLDLFRETDMLNHHIWCIEMAQIRHINGDIITAEPSHLMYWNPKKYSEINAESLAEPSHLMYWNIKALKDNKRYTVLNHHIWCIEMRAYPLIQCSKFCWTITFDVLKYRLIHGTSQGCFGWTITFDVLKFDYNSCLWQPSPRWTITFDVLKWYQTSRRPQAPPALNHHIWCIEIYFLIPTVLFYQGLNHHIWCIEILWYYIKAYRQYCWTITFDVLKSRE